MPRPRAGSPRRTGGTGRRRTCRCARRTARRADPPAIRSGLRRRPRRWSAPPRGAGTGGGRMRAAAEPAAGWCRGRDRWPTTTSAPRSRSAPTAFFRCATDSAGLTRCVTSLAPTMITARSTPRRAVRSSASTWSSSARDSAPTTARLFTCTGRRAASEIPIARRAAGVSRSRCTPYPAAVESPSIAIRIGGRPALTPAAVHVVSCETGGGSTACGMRCRASLDWPTSTPKRAAPPTAPSAPIPPPPYAAAAAIFLAVRALLTGSRVAMRGRASRSSIAEKPPDDA